MGVRVGYGFDFIRILFFIVSFFGEVSFSRVNFLIGYVLKSLGD